MLDRLATFGTGPDADKRRASADKKSIVTLSARGIYSSLRATLRAAVKTAQSAPLPASADTEAAHLESLKGAPRLVRRLVGNRAWRVRPAR